MRHNLMLRKSRHVDHADRGPQDRDADRHQAIDRRQVQTMYDRSKNIHIRPLSQFHVADIATDTSGMHSDHPVHPAT